MIKKTLLTALLTAPLLGGSLHSAYAATEFSDISNSYAKDAINQLVDAGILNGIGNGQFNPTGKISRQDFAVILAKALNLDTESIPPTATFSDIPPSHYAYKYVEAVAKAGLFQGIGSGQFGLGQNLSRQDMAVLFVRALGADAKGYGDKLVFSDADKIAGYAKDAVGFAVGNGLLSGIGSGKFNPSGVADRQSVALVTSRFLETAKPSTASPQQPVVTTPAPVTPPVPSLPVAPLPSVSSGNTGGSTETPVRDVQAPALTLVSSAPFKIGTDLTVHSSEAGTAYLVPYASEILNKSALDALVSEGKGVKATIATANSRASLATSALDEGSYKAYAVDGSGNVSTPAIEIVLQKFPAGPEFEIANSDTISAPFPEELDYRSQPSLEDFIITRTDGETNSNFKIFQAYVSSDRINFLMYDSLVKGGTYEVVYKPKDINKPIKSIDGKVYGPFVSTFTYTNNAPYSNVTLYDMTLMHDSTWSALNLSSSFSDWDDDELNFTANSDNTDVVDASVDGGLLYLHTKSLLATATISLTADDGNGGKTSRKFKVTVVNAAAAINAAEEAIAEDKDLTGKSVDRSEADIALIKAQILLASLPDDETKTQYANRLNAIAEKLIAISEAEAVITALEEATANDKILLLGEEARNKADAANSAEKSFQYSDLVTGTSLNLLQTRAEAARSLIANADTFEDGIKTIKNTAGYYDDLSKGSENRTFIDSILGALPYNGLTEATKATFQSELEWILTLLAYADIAEKKVAAFEHAVAAAEGKPADAPEWQTAYAAKEAIDYNELNSATAHTLSTRENAAASKLPSPASATTPNP